MICEKHGCAYGDGHECAGCVREERDRLRSQATEDQFYRDNELFWTAHNAIAERDQLRQAVMRLQADKAARDANEIPCRCEENKKIILRLQDERDRLREKLEEAKLLIEEALSQSIVHGPFDQVPCMCDWCVAARKVVGS